MARLRGTIARDELQITKQSAINRDRRCARTRFAFAGWASPGSGETECREPDGSSLVMEWADRVRWQSCEALMIDWLRI
jgi:hypothetical protein